MIEHRHVWPNGKFSQWHNAERKHVEKYANDTEFETRVKGETSNGKRPTPIRPNLKQDPEATRTLYELERID